MPDSSQVIRALECFADPDVFTREKCFDCPYRSVDCELSVMRDALELLKENERELNSLGKSLCDATELLRKVKYR